MADDILSYADMCQREGQNLQRGMNFTAGQNYSILLMSTRPNSPYQDRYEDGNTTLIYEGHDISRRYAGAPKSVDQPEYLPSGALTENGKFHQAAQNYRQGLQPAKLVKVYEKIRDGIWSFNGLFRLVDSFREVSGGRQVFKFRLESCSEDDAITSYQALAPGHHRLIPSSVKQEVWKRDEGRCVQCGSTTNLHFDHIIPYSKGGTSTNAANIQLLCSRHNLAKRDNIE